MVGTKDAKMIDKMQVACLYKLEGLVMVAVGFHRWSTQLGAVK